MFRFKRRLAIASLCPSVPSIRMMITCKAYTHLIFNTYPLGATRNRTSRRAEDLQLPECSLPRAGVPLGGRSGMPAVYPWLPLRGRHQHHQSERWVLLRELVRALSWDRESFKLRTLTVSCRDTAEYTNQTRSISSYEFCLVTAATTTSAIM